MHFQCSILHISKMFFKTVIVLFQLHVCFGAKQNKTYVPLWVDLECEEGHKYAFAEIFSTWEEAILECQFYGGWLVDVKDQKEHNCLMRYGTSQEFDDYYWTDANDQ